MKNGKVMESGRAHKTLLAMCLITRNEIIFIISYWTYISNTIGSSFGMSFKWMMLNKI